MTMLKVSVFINMLMVVNMLGTGIKINNMVLEKKNGMTTVCTKVSITMLVKRVKVNISGQMVTDM